MKCRMCESPVDHDMQFCITCGVPLNFAVEKANALSIARKIRNKVLFWSCVVCGLLQIVSMLLFPGGHSMLKANMAAVASRGRDIYVAITSANVEREPLGLPYIWPRTYQAYSYMLDLEAFKRYKTSFDYFAELFDWANDGAEKHAVIDWEPLGLKSRWEKTCLSYTNLMDDMAFKAYQTSSDYFYELYDGPNMGTDQHDPYVKGFDFSKLAGAGIPAKSGAGKLTHSNNMWIMAANITDQDDDRIPLLITRNLDVKEIARVVNQGLNKSEFKKRITFSEIYKKPFRNEGFIAVRKDGRTICITKSRKATLGELFENQEFPPRDPSKPPIVYLMP